MKELQNWKNKMKNTDVLCLLRAIALFILIAPYLVSCTARKKTTAIDTSFRGKKIEIASTSQLRCFDRTIIDTFIFMSKKDTFQIYARSDERATTHFVDTNFVVRIDTATTSKIEEKRFENPLMAQSKKNGGTPRLLAAVAIIFIGIITFFALRLKMKK